MANILSEELNVLAPQQPKRQPVLRMIKKLGEGAFGAVFLFENTKKDCLFAVKRISVQTENENRPVKIEFLIQEGLSKRGHPNVVKTIGMRSYPQFYTLSLDESPSYLTWLSNEKLNEDPWKRMDAESITLLRKILTDDPETRATIKQLLSESWFEEDSKNIETVNDRSLKRERDENDSSAQQNALEHTLLVKRQRLD
ncbi:hypothetical protein CAEBREN_14438 [Caenorhabditis brenneri]|uniref:Protein kinase domain-containing protein n=1 Tax=Caenorhabditis brenneri TaxID=135651 RepID=G0NKT8_CAEBE|nr:hypothetical protein CAEBREN_14438 [Caenorhabditis brenneri]